MMIKGAHLMFYSDDPAATRAFLQDKLRLPGNDAGGGWLIFDLKGADVGVHGTEHEGSPVSGTHDISFYCDDLAAEVEAMKGRGVEFSDEISNQGYALTVHFEMPGGVKCELFQPKYK